MYTELITDLGGDTTAAYKVKAATLLSDFKDAEGKAGIKKQTDVNGEPTLDYVKKINVFLESVNATLTNELRYTNFIRLLISSKKDITTLS
ncbi:MAG: hypothetical protein EOM41_08215 [Bacilli bacterium]|nr:hypothetical protein [Bacilli bacterium]